MPNVAQIPATDAGQIVQIQLDELLERGATILTGGTYADRN